MQEFEFQPDTKYRFIAENLNVSHPFTIGASINGSDIIKFTKITQPDLPEPEEHNFTGVTEDLDVISNELLMPPVEEDFLDDYVLSLDGDYFDFEYSRSDLTIFDDNDVNFYYLCNIHSSMNDRLFLGWGEQSEGYPIYELNDNQIMDVTGLSWTELEAKAPSASFIQNYGGKFALIEESLVDHQMPDDPYGNSVIKLFPVIQDQNNDWILELPGFDGYDSQYDRAYFEDDLGLLVFDYFYGDNDGNLTEFEEYPVFWVTPELFWELTYIDWEWTSFAKFEDPQMGRGAYFAFEDTESAPTYYDPVHGDHEILESYNLIHVPN